MGKKLEGVRTLTPKNIKSAVQALLAAKLPVFIWGPPGVGKSDLIAQIAAEDNRPVVDLRLLLLEPTDLKGIPFYDPNLKEMRWAPPTELPKNEGVFARALLFLDELNAAPPSVQAAAYQLVLNRRVGEYRLPDQAVIVCAGNRDTDKGVTYKMPTPLANRLTHLNIEVNFDDWREWALKNSVHPDVVGYLSHSSGHLFDFDPTRPDKSFATPRSWNFVSQMLGTSEAQLTDSVMTAIVAGQVGNGIAGEFMEHRRVASKMPHPDKVLRGEEKKLNESLKKEISAQYALATRLSYKLREKYIKTNESTGKEKEKNAEELAQWGDNFFRFCLDNLSPELTVFAALTLMRDYSVRFNAAKMPAFKELAAKYKSHITGSEN